LEPRPIHHSPHSEAYFAVAGCLRNASAFLLSIVFQQSLPQDYFFTCFFNPYLLRYLGKGCK
jgi:hypothetical protein